MEATFCSAYGQEVDVSQFEEAVISVAIDIDADAQDHDSLASNAVLHGDHRGQFYNARGTPRRPEIQDHDLTAELAQSHGAIGVLHGEVAGGIADARRAGTGDATRGEQSR